MIKKLEVDAVEEVPDRKQGKVGFRPDSTTNNLEQTTRFFWTSVY